MSPLLPFVLALALGQAPTLPTQSGGSQDPTVRAGVPEGLSAEDWASIRATYEAGRHAVLPEGGGHFARNPRQRWMTRFDGRGFTVEPDGAEWTWGLELTRWGFAGSEAQARSAEGTSVEGQRVTYGRGDELSEWYVNDERGLEHGYTVHLRPRTGARSDTRLAFVLAVRGDLEPEVSDDGRGVRFATTGGVVVLTYSGLVVHDAVGRELPARIELGGEDLRLTIDERAAHYPITIDPVAQQAYLKASNTHTADFFGGAVSVSGDTAIVGARYQSTPMDLSGAAYVFVRNGSTWAQQAYLKAEDPGFEDHFGISVSVDGDTAVIGAPGEASSATGVNGDQFDNTAKYSGAAYVFVRSGTTWSQEAYLKASNTEASDQFGWSASVSGDTVVVGALLEDSNATGTGGDQTDNSAKDSGSAYVFVRNGTDWSQQAYVKASNTDVGDYFGVSSSVSGDTVVIGARWEDSNATGVNGDHADNSSENSGAAYVFVRSGAIWSQQAYLKASNTGSSDLFGGSLSLAGDTVVIGAVGEDSDATGVNGDQNNGSAGNSGAAYVLVRSGVDWSQQAYLKASNTGAGDDYGHSVSVYGDTVVVGALREDSSATGSNGDQSDNSDEDAGAAYTYTRSGSIWGQDVYMKASNTDTLDFFGSAVSVLGDTILVGAQGEFSGATGVDGDQTDNSAPFSGAAYVFDFEEPCGVKYCGSSQNPSNSALIAIDTCDSASSSITLSLSIGPPNQFTFLLVGDGQTTISQPPGSAGDLCVAGGSCLGRYAEDIGKITSGGTFAVDIQNALSDPCGGAVVIAPGASWNFQFWHRLPQGGGGAPSSFSEAIAVTFE